MGPDVSVFKFNSFDRLPARSRVRLCPRSWARPRDCSEPGKRQALSTMADKWVQWCFEESKMSQMMRIFFLNLKPFPGSTAPGRSTKSIQGFVGNGSSSLRMPSIRPLDSGSNCCARMISPQYEPHEKIMGSGRPARTHARSQRFWFRLIATLSLRAPFDSQPFFQAHVQGWREIPTIPLNSHRCSSL